MTAYQGATADTPFGAQRQVFEDEMEQLEQLWQAAMRAEKRRKARLERQRMAELADYARAGIEVIPPGSMTDCIDADQSPE